ncbi:MAG: hydrogenase maturation protease [Sulfolobales archaeon]
MLVVSTEAELEEFLRNVIIPGDTVIVGIGSELRCDDGFGVYLARSLSNLLEKYSKRECVTVVDAGTVLESYLDILNSNKVSILLDAIEAPIPPSEIALLSGNEISDHRVVLSTHTIDVSLLLNLVTSEIFVVGTRPQCLDIRLGVTKPVAQAIQRTIKAVISVLENLGCIETPFCVGVKHCREF